MKKKKLMGWCLILAAVCCLGSAFLLGGGKKQIEPDITGMKDITINVGDELPNLTAGIEMTESVTGVSVDASAVNKEKPGKYQIIYYYEDEGGNQFSKTVTCTVKAPMEEALETEAAVSTETVIVPGKG